MTTDIDTTGAAAAANAVETDVLLQLTDVRKVFRSDVMKKPQVALDGLTCAFPRHACTGLLGHNGAGKTTTIRMILGLVRPDRGAVLFEGRNLRVQDKRWIGYMPEVNKLPAALTPEEILTHHLQLFMPEDLPRARDRAAAVDEHLTRVGLAAHRRKRIGKLSKGMARRLAWAQATIHKPRLLVLDEPSSGLDPLGRREMLTWIAAEKSRGTTILLCTHELLQVQTLCDQYYILNRGRLVYTSAPRGDSAGVRDRQSYNIHISGGDEAALQRYVESGSLPPWTALRREGFLSILALPDYAAASRWLRRLTDDGFVVVRFGDEAFVGEDELLPYFKGVD
jgi:ABC-2 type transport system ATP-binding protein